MIGLRASLAAALVCLVLAPRASAERGRAPIDDPLVESARIHLRAGIAHFSEGHFEDALREMESARRLHPSPDLDYNVGQCLERLGRTSDAIVAYRSYLAGNLRGTDRAEVEQRVAALEARSHAVAPSPQIVREVVFKTIIVYRTPPPPPGRVARWTGVGLSVLGAGALAAFIGTLVVSERERDLVSAGGSPDAPVRFEGALRDAESRSTTLQTVAWVSLGISAVSLGAAGALFALGRKMDREAPRLTLAPGGPGGLGMTLSGRF